MKALWWYGTGDVRVETVPDQKIPEPRDAIIKTTTATVAPIRTSSTASCRRC